MARECMHSWSGIIPSQYIASGPLSHASTQRGSTQIAKLDFIYIYKCDSTGINE